MSEVQNCVICIGGRGVDSTGRCRQCRAIWDQAVYTERARWIDAIDRRSHAYVQQGDEAGSISHNALVFLRLDVAGGDYDEAGT